MLNSHPKGKMAAPVRAVLVLPRMRIDNWELSIGQIHPHCAKLFLSEPLVRERRTLESSGLGELLQRHDFFGKLPVDDPRRIGFYSRSFAFLRLRGVLSVWTAFGVG